MLAWLKTLWHYIRYTCMTNCMSINLGGGLAFITLIVLSGSFSVLGCILLTLLIDGIIFTMMNYSKNFLSAIKDPQIHSNMIGGMLGCGWICLLYACFV